MKVNEPRYRILGKTIRQRDLHGYIEAVTTLNLLDDERFIKMLPPKATIKAGNWKHTYMKKVKDPAVLSTRLTSLMRDGSFISEKLQVMN